MQILFKRTFSSMVRRRYHTIIGLIVTISLVYIVMNLTNPNYDFDDDHTRKLLFLAENSSFCSKRSTQRGYNQHVLSVSAYESSDRIELKTSLTWSFIQLFARDAKKFYPTWVVRVYYYNLHNKSKEDIVNLEKQYDNLDFCDAENLPVLGNVINKIPGKMQRFLPAIDPFVGIGMSRDLDSEIYQREVDAVNEWLYNTTYAFHIMRDHEQHAIEILGGMWGIASNRLSIKDRLTIASVLLPSENLEEREKYLKLYSKVGDQLFLTHHVWPIARRNSLVHDSFTCLWSRYIYRSDTRPFPSEREHPSCFVGCPKPCCTPEMKSNKDLSNYKKCPSSCRPYDHQNWLFC